MGAPKMPTVIQAPTPASTENPYTQQAIQEQQALQRRAAQNALGRSQTMLSGSDVNPVTGEAAGAGSLLGG